MNTITSKTTCRSALLIRTSGEQGKMAVNAEKQNTWKLILGPSVDKPQGAWDNLANFAVVAVVAEPTRQGKAGHLHATWKVRHSDGEKDVYSLAYRGHKDALNLEPVSTSHQELTEAAALLRKHRDAQSREPGSSIFSSAGEPLSAVGQVTSGRGLQWPELLAIAGPGEKFTRPIATTRSGRAALKLLADAGISATNFSHADKPAAGYRLVGPEVSFGWVDFADFNGHVDDITKMLGYLPHPAYPSFYWNALRSNRPKVGGPLTQKLIIPSF